MATVTKYNLTGKKLGQVAVDDEFVNIEANGQMIKDYIVALRANARQWSAHTKTRSEVQHTTKKPHPQKGTGRARAGCLVAPQHRGGGRVHSPRAKFDQHVRINKKERRAAIQFLLAEKIRNNRLSVIDSMNMDAAKTKTVADFIGKAGWDGRILFLSGSEEPQDHFRMSVRNIPKASFLPAVQVSGYDVLVAKDIVVTEAGFNEIMAWLR